MALRVLIVDSGMRTLGGHNFSYTQAVRAALEEKGATVDVIVSRGLPSDIAEAHRFHPVLSLSAYDFALGHGFLRDLAYVYAQSHVFAEDLEHGLRCVLSRDYDLVFSHTPADFELVGWARYLRRQPFSGTLALVLRQTPRFRACGVVRRWLNPYWRLRPHYLARLRSRLGGRFVLCTDSEALSEDYRHVYRGRVVTLPIPVGADLFASAPGGEGSIARRYALGEALPVRVGYLGDARASKGFPELAAVVRAVIRAGVPARFIVQCPRPAAGDEHSAPPRGLPELQALAAEPGNRLTLVPEKLTTEDYADLFRHLDIVLIPYLHDTYREATSGIFTEALALGKPVVVPSDTWMARELGASGAGVVFPRDRPQELGPVVVAAIRGYGELRAAAARMSAGWRAFHNPGTLAERLLTEVESGRHPS